MKNESYRQHKGKVIPFDRFIEYEDYKDDEDMVDLSMDVGLLMGMSMLRKLEGAELARKEYADNEE